MDVNYDNKNSHQEISASETILAKYRPFSFPQTKSKMNHRKSVFLLASWI